MIEVEDLVYDYPGTRALAGVSLRVQSARIAALVGPNGAGKTTLLRCLAALDRPYAGRVRVAGLDTAESPREVHRLLGYLQDFYGLYDELSVARCLTFAARARGVAAADASRAVAWAAEVVGLADRMATLAGALSRGLRQRLAIAQALVHRPRVLLLDEPAAGLDPEARRELSRLLLGLKAEGMTLVVSSHILAELEDYSDEMIILDRGRIVRGEPGAPSATMAVRVVLAAPRAELAEVLAGLPGTSEVSVDGATARFQAPAEARVAILAGLVRAGLPVAEFVGGASRMEDVYMREIERARRP